LKLAPLTVTKAAPEGEMLLAIGVETGAMFALKLLEAVWPAEPLA
jgi:hypothetical protein